MQDRRISWLGVWKETIVSWEDVRKILPRISWFAKNNRVCRATLHCLS